MLIKKISHDIIDNRTSDLAICSAMVQGSSIPRQKTDKKKKNKNVLI